MVKNWQPKNKERYWYIGVDKEVHPGRWQSTIIDEERLRTGRVFQTFQLAAEELIGATAKGKK